MSDTAMTSFLGSCLDLLQTLMEVKEVYFHSKLSEIFTISKIVGLLKTKEKFSCVNFKVLTQA